MADAQLLPERILFGAAFYNEYRVNGDLERDLDLMAEASFSVIRVGESVWATWEPEPGADHLDWLQPVLDGAHARGIAVVLDIALDDEQLAAWYRAMGERGFTSGKLKGGRDVDRDIRRLGIVADALSGNGVNPALMLDANESWNLKQAVRYVTAIEKHRDLTWIEQPLRRWDAAGHARLGSSIRAAVATGENLTGLEQFAPLFDRGAVDIVQVGCVWGVTHSLRVAHAAHSRDLPISPVGLTANPAVAHAAAAVPNHLSTEVQDLGSPFGISIDQQFIDGGIVLGDIPGNGVTIDEDAIAANQRTSSGTTSAAPHVRSHRAGLHLVTEAGTVDR